MTPATLLRPENRDRLKSILERELARAEAEEQAQEAERRFKQEQGEKASFEAEKIRCAADVVHWFNHWVWTYDPRLIGKPGGAYVPMKLWPRQEQYVRWLLEKIAGNEEGLTEKCRDAGITYLMAGTAINRWLFVPGFKATFGSREADLVDNRDNPDSIFEKIRIILRRLPAWMMPEGFDWRHHDNIMQLTNPTNGASITGEAGDNMGRGGRSTVYLIDEAAFVPRAQSVHRAIAGSTDCIQWVSSVNGMGNLFYRKRQSLPSSQVFIFDLKDDPRKTPAWIAAKKSSMDPVDWASEYERDYGASVEGVCIPGAWVQSAQRLLQLVPELAGWAKSGRGRSGGDVGGGKAESVVVHRFGPLVLEPAISKRPDTTETAHWMLAECKKAGSVLLNYDSVGIGAGVQSTLNKATTGIERVAVNVGDHPTNRVWSFGQDQDGNDETRTSKELFRNLKMELWWLARAAFQRTHQHVLFLSTKGKEGTKHSVSDLIAMCQDNTLAAQLSTPRYFKEENGKMILETKKQLQTRGIPSPDRAEAFILTFLDPADEIPDIRIPDDFHRTNPAKIGEA